MTLNPTQAKNILCALDAKGKGELGDVAVAAGEAFAHDLSRFAMSSSGLGLDEQKRQVRELCTKFLGEGMVTKVSLKDDAPATVVLNVKSLEALAAQGHGKGGR